MTQRDKELQICVRASLQRYIDDLQGQEPSNMYDMLTRAVEQPLLDFVMHNTKQNQSKAAKWLGLNRNTLRKKLIDHGMLEQEK